jgi:uncharacterized protein (DUF58 family)
VVALLAVMQLVIPYRGWTILFVGLAGLWISAYFWARSLAYGLRVKRETRFGVQHVGDTMLERFSLINDASAPAAWLQIADQSTMTNLQMDLATNIEGGGTQRRHREILCTRRGVFTLGPTTVHSGDPFGIYSVEVHDPATMSLLVLPQIVELPEIEVASGGTLDEGRPREDALVQTVSSSRATEYRPGDSARWIHWPTSARRDGLYVRMFDSAPAGNWWIVLDLDESMQVGEGHESTLEYAIILAASLADRALNVRRAVGLVSQDGDQDWVWLPPRSDSAQRWEILRALALVSSGSWKLSDLLLRMLPTFRQSASLIVVTASPRPDWVASLLPLMQAGAVPTVLMLDRVTFGGEDDGTQTIRQLASLGIPHFIAPRELLEAPEPVTEPWRGSRPSEHPWRVVR